MKHLSLLLLLTPMLIVSAYAQCTYTLQPGPEEGKDARIFSLNCSTSYAASSGNCATTNFMSSNVLFSQSWTFWGAAGSHRSLVEFDLQTLNTGCTVQYAYLKLFSITDLTDHCGQNSSWVPCKNNSFYITRIKEPWLENTVTWVNQPQTVTSSNPQDRVLVGDSSFTPYKDYTVDLTDMVQFWKANPDSNFGFRIELVGEGDHYRSIAFTSSDHQDAARRPMLVVGLDCAANDVCNNIISGNVYDDHDQNCSRTTGDLGLDDWMVKIEPGPMYATTDQFGNYSVNVDQGTYTVTPILKNEYQWNSGCAPSYTVQFTTADTAVSGIDFPLQAENYCADLWVDIGVNRMRKCHNEWFVVEYCNNGNLTANNVYIDVTLDDFITPQFATLPFTYNADSSLRFWLDSLTPYTCGFFQISTIIDCDVEFGITQCARADIYPRHLCEPVDSTWDKSSVIVTGNCQGDTSVCFYITNTGDAGNGDMDGTSKWRLYEDGLLIQTGVFQLNGQETLELCFPANGHTLKLEANQRPGHPGNSHPNEIIEACGNDTSVAIVSAMSFTEDDADSYTEIICEVVRASYDPNEKVGKPWGLTEDRHIAPNTPMEYTLHFQNTGNDTAWLVVLRDTLPAELDVTTIVSGVASHPYSFKVKENGIVEWRFEQIVLVDSATNEDESMGYVKFKINPSANLAHGTWIKNRAGIYFDFNPPVITEYAWHMVWEPTIEPSTVASPWNNKVGVIVYPNPAKEQIHFNFTEVSHYTITLYNAVGRNVQHVRTGNQYNTLNIEHLAAGMYVYAIRNEAGDVVSGKFIKE